ncbi:hypothetical protein ACIBG0_04005 [Nocardia sp. NPDC050630]|uniref:hypothetical protein n=1 Tax=Nocardia sp. NPDC050630 TaxID=3364321 RepID=UPI0037873531
MADSGVLPLLDRVAGAVAEAIGRARPELVGTDPMVRRSERADFQSNVALAVAKRARVRSAEFAAELVAALDSDDALFDAVMVSGPGS